MEKPEEIIEEQNQVKEEKKVKDFKSLLTPRVKILIGVVIFAVILLCIFGVLATRQIRKQSQEKENQSKNLSPKATVFFNPSTVNATPGKSNNIDIMIDTWGTAITGANISIKYNPNVITNISLVRFKDTNSALSLAFQDADAIDDKKGNIVLPLEMAISTPPQKGHGKVATLTFTTKDTNITKTDMTFTASTTLLTREAQETIFLQRGILIINYPIDGVFPTQPTYNK